MSTNQFLLRTLAETMISKIIRDIKTGTNRSLRNSIDLGIYFSKGPIQKEFFEMAKSITNNSNNIYLPLMKRALDNVDESLLKNISLNLGISSFTIGAKQIQEFYDMGKSPELWIKLLDEYMLKDNFLLQDKISRCNTDGTYAFVLDNINDDFKIKKAISIASISKKSTFLLKIDMDTLNSDILMELSASKNIIIFVTQNKDTISKDIFCSLKGSHLLYGFCRNYNALKDIRAEKGFLKEAIDLGCLFGVYIDTPETFNDYEHIRYEKICQSRITGELPIILYDFYRDCRFIQDIILHKKHLILED